MKRKTIKNNLTRSQMIREILELDPNDYLKNRLYISPKKEVETIYKKLVKLEEKEKENEIQKWKIKYHNY